MRFLFFTLFLSFFFAIPQISLAQTSPGFTVDRFDARIVVAKEGFLSVRETISGEFLESRHGLIRSIPFRYDHGDGRDALLNIAVLSVEDGLGNTLPYEVTTGFETVDIRIGDPDKVIQGPYVFAIEYTVHGAIQYFDDHDEVYWNVTGNDWPVEIAASSAIVELPEGAFTLMFSCFTGAPGLEEQKCTVEDRYRSVFIEGVGPLTVAVGFERGIVAHVDPRYEEQWRADESESMIDESLYYEEKRARELGRSLVLTSLFPLALLLFHILARRAGRDDGRLPHTLIAEYEPPKDLRPTEAAVFLDGKLDAKDLSAFIVDLAVRGYLRIDEEKENFVLLKLREQDEAMRDWEKTAFARMFGSKMSVDQKQAGWGLSHGYYTIEGQIFDLLKAQGFLKGNPRTKWETWKLIGIGSAMTCALLGVLATAYVENPAPFIAGIAVFIPFLLTPRMGLRTAKGVETLQKLKGFQLFLETAEKYRIEWQEKEGIFEHYLPYAMIFGIAKKWSETYEHMASANVISASKIGWYGGGAMNAVSIASHLGAFSSMMSLAAKPVRTVSMSSGTTSMRSYKTPSSRGGSGSGIAPSSRGGSGSSGGGFGGGGGKSW